jgi:heme-degrading monooxygenase HmoA
MIARHWRGWTARENAEAYEQLLKNRVLPGLAKVEGHRGAMVLRRDVEGEVEFVVINLFDSLEAVRRFAGPDYTVAVFEPEAETLLSRVEPFAVHFDVREDSRHG